MINKLVLSGGGINGIIYIGILKYLESSNQIKYINNFVGSSVGAIVNTLICIGYSSQELEHFILYFNLDMIKNINIENLFTNYGIDNGNKLEIMLKCIIRNKLNIDDISLMGLYQKTLKTNTIITTCLNDKKVIYLNHHTHPNLNIIKALLMTSSIPLYFNPIKYNNKYYIDGCVLNHFGINFFKKEHHTIFGVLLNENKNCININSFESYISNIIELILTNTDIKYYNDPKILVIDYVYSILNFNISNNDKKKMIKLGYEKAYLYFKKNN